MDTFSLSRVLPLVLFFPATVINLRKMDLDNTDARASTRAGRVGLPVPLCRRVGRALVALPIQGYKWSSLATNGVADDFPPRLLAIRGAILVEGESECWKQQGSGEDWGGVARRWASRGDRKRKPLRCEPDSIIYAQKMHRNHANHARNAQDAQPRGFPNPLNTSTLRLAVPPY